MKSFSRSGEPAWLVAPRAVAIKFVVRVEADGGKVDGRLVKPAVIVVDLCLGGFQVNREVVLGRTSCLVIDEFVRPIPLLQLTK